jgi:hypothetical protein
MKDLNSIKIIFNYYSKKKFYRVFIIITISYKYLIDLINIKETKN